MRTHSSPGCLNSTRRDSSKLKHLLALAFLVLVPLAASAQPDASSVVHQLAAGRDLSTAEAQAQFADDVVCKLHSIDPRWGHLRKNPGQTQVHGHAEDAVLWLSDTPGQSVAVDFIGASGSPAARPTWQPDQPRYSSTDWVSPVGHNGCGSNPEPTPVPAPTVDLTPVIERLDNLTETVQAIISALQAIDAEQHEWTQITHLMLDRISQQQLQPLKGNVLGFGVTLRPVVAPDRP